MSSPASAAEVAQVLSEASRLSRVVIPHGGGTKQHIGFVAEDSALIVSTRRLDRVHHYDAGDLTVGVGAGTTLSQLQTMLAEQGQFLPVDPMLPERATVGGLLATNAHGPLKAGFGGLRDFCIGIEFATAGGFLAKAGSKVVKNVAGYDLMKLLIGSMGTLGVITAANFKVYPKPARTTTFVADFPDEGECIDFRNRLRTSLRGSFMAMEIISPQAHEYMADRQIRDPDDYAPTAPIKRTRHWSVAIRLSGSAAVVDRYRSELHGSQAREIGDDTAFWRRVSDFEVRVSEQHRNSMVLYVSAPLSEASSVLIAADEVASQYTMLSASIGRITTGNLIVCLIPLAVDPPSAVAYANAVSALRGRVSKHVSVVAARCPEESKRHFDVWGSSPTNLSVMRAVKDALDPLNILNRGRFLFS